MGPLNHEHLFAAMCPAALWALGVQCQIKRDLADLSEEPLSHLVELGFELATTTCSSRHLKSRVVFADSRWSDKLQRSVRLHAASSEPFTVVESSTNSHGRANALIGSDKAPSSLRADGSSNGAHQKLLHYVQIRTAFLTCFKVQFFHSVPDEGRLRVAMMVRHLSFEAHMSIAQA